MFAQQALLDRLGAEEDLSALFLVGSFAEGLFDAASDIDLLALTTERKGRLLFRCQTTQVEVTFGTHDSFLKQMQSAASDNNNYVLNLMSTARLLMDRDGNGRSLLESALDLHKLLPPARAPRP